MRTLAKTLAGGAMLGLMVLFSACFTDGPVAIFPGGPLVAGELAPHPASWDFASEGETLELQLLAPPRSRTVWFVVHEGALYIPCGAPRFKQWPHDALADGRVLLRYGGKRYPGQAVQVSDADEFRAAGIRVRDKYMGGDAEPDPADFWIFRIDPRAEAAGP